MGTMIRVALAVPLLVLFAAAAPAQVRIKDITEVSGARSNQLIGYGLVTGLDGTGSRSSNTQAVAVDMLQRQGYTTAIFSSNPAEPIFRSTNNSLVIVTAEIGPYSRRGTKIDVTVSSMDDARSLKGGILGMTPLRGADGQVYAVAQGAVSIGGFSVEGQAARVQKNQLNAGRIPDGAMIEKEAPGEMTKNGRIEFLLKDADYNTARLIAKAVNQRYPNAAEATDAGRVVVCPPLDAKKTVVEIIAEVGVMEVRPDTTAKVIINERTGTVFAGENVTIGTAAIMHGNLFISTAETPFVVQPNPFSGGTTAVVPRTQATATEQRSRMVVLPRATTVADVARGMNALGVSPQDVMSIFQLLKDGGALNAELRSIR
jgi:flagellar P-ring protein FlgI